MPNSRGPGILRRLAALLIRGPEAGFILGDLDDAMERELARGFGVWRARWRYTVNMFGSAFSVWRTRWRLPSLLFSGLDIKLGFRMLGKQPGLAFVAIFALAIGIPVGLAPSHAAEAFEAPPPVDGGDRIQVLKNLNVATSRWERSSLHDFVQWRAELTTFETLAAAANEDYNVIWEDAGAAPVRGAGVTASMFDVLRVGPLLGRTLIPADEVIGAPRVVIISYDLWQSRLDGDPNVIGRTIRIGRIQHTVVGVMPDKFLFPSRHHLWLPLRGNVLTEERGKGRPLLIFGRLSDGVSQEEAQAELTAVGRRTATEFPQTHARLQPEVVPFTIGLFGFKKGGLRAEGGFYAFQVLALLVLVVACVNIGMLIFTRTATRSRELEVRTAPSANRTRVVSQLFTESLVLAVLAAGAGLLLADQIASSRIDWFVDLLPQWIDLGVTRVTVFWALGLAVFSAAIVGVVPALKVTGKSIQRNIQRASAGSSGIRFGGMSSALIIADVALAVATIGMAVGLSDGLTKVGDGIGIETEQFLSAELGFPRIDPTADAATFDQTEFVARVSATQQELVRRLTAEPGVRGVTVGSALPRMKHPYRRIELDGEDQTDEGRAQGVRSAHVDMNFFNAFEQPILTGRGFDMMDLGENRSTVIVNTSFVERVLGGQNPIGRRVRYTASTDEEPGPWYEIVGVVGPLGMNDINPGADGGIYHPSAPGEIHPLRVAIHVGSDPESFTPRLRALASEVDPTAIISNTVSLNELSTFDGRIMEWIKLGAGIFTGILLALSASGIYALMSFTVTERTREIGIRTALGAPRSRVVFTIARRALAQLGLGVGLGLPIAGTLLVQFKSQMGSTHSPLVVTLILGVSVMVLIGLLACTAPTLRALRIQPTEALREGG